MSEASWTASIGHILNGHDPFSAVSVDRIWNPQRANDSAKKFFAAACGTGLTTLLRDLHSRGALRENIRNWPEAPRALFRLLDLEVARSPHEDEGKALLGRLKELPSVASAIADHVKRASRAGPFHRVPYR